MKKAPPFPPFFVSPTPREQEKSTPNTPFSLLSPSRIGQSKNQSKTRERECSGPNKMPLRLVKLGGGRKSVGAAKGRVRGCGSGVFVGGWVGGWVVGEKAERARQEKKNRMVTDREVLLTNQGAPPLPFNSLSFSRPNVFVAVAVAVVVFFCSLPFSFFFIVVVFCFFLEGTSPEFVALFGPARKKVAGRWGGRKRGEKL